MSQQPTDPSVSHEPEIPNPRGIGPGPYGIGPGPYAAEKPIARITLWLRRLFGGSGPGEPPMDSRK